MLEKTTRINMLFDFYHALLTNKQKEYMTLYYREDYSLGEISDLWDVSRQAVYDNIKRTEQLLETYEEKLQLYEKFQRRNDLLNLLKEHFSHGQEKNDVIQLIDQLQKMD